MEDDVIVRKYKGNEARVDKDFKYEVAIYAERGYEPTSKDWVPGAYGCGSFLVALVLCFVLVGILIFIYMMIVKPAGTLTVTFEPVKSEDLKSCPQCAEEVKAAAKVCRFCQHEFDDKTPLETIP